MRIDIKKLAIATMLTWAGWYTICAFLVAVAPATTQAVFSYVFHYELNGQPPDYLGVLLPRDDRD